VKRFLLDTNVVSELRKSRPHGAVMEWLRTISAHNVFVPAIVFGEMQAGIELTREQDRNKAKEIEGWLDDFMQSAQLVNMDVVCFREWARLMHDKSDDLLEDAMIAATARTYGFVIATRNESDFKHFDVEILNPFKFK
jgi:predicted nucleic acid-binding protein